MKDLIIGFFKAMEFQNMDSLIERLTAFGYFESELPKNNLEILKTALSVSDTLNYADTNALTLAVLLFGCEYVQAPTLDSKAQMIMDFAVQWNNEKTV